MAVEDYHRRICPSRVCVDAADFAERLTDAVIHELASAIYDRKKPTIEAIKLWLKWMAEPGTCNLKEEYKVSQIPRDAHQLKHPVTEFAEMVDDHSKIIVVTTGTNKDKTN